MSIILICSFFADTAAFAESVSVRYSGTAEPNSLVSLMVVDSDTDADALAAEDIHTTDILTTDENGNFEKTVDFDDAEIDDLTNKITNYKVMSNAAEINEEILGNRYGFASFTVSPVEENGVLYVPIEETLDLIGGETVSYTYNEDNKTYTGKANNGEFIIVMGEDTVEVDWVDIELPGILKEIGGTNMMPAYAIKYLLKTGDVVFTSGSKAFSLTEGVKEAGYDWDSNVLASKIDQLVDTDTRVVIDSSTDYGSIYSHDWRQDGSTIHRTADASEWGDVYTIENIPDNGATGGYELAIVIGSSGDREIVFENDHIGVFHFKARTVYTNDESGSALFQLALQRRAEGDSAIMQYSTALAEQTGVPYDANDGEQKWKDYYFLVDSGTTELVDGSWIKIVPIGKAAKFEMCDIQLWDFGARADCDDKIELMKPMDGYKGIEDDHVWRQEAWNRIEKYRKEDISVEVVDASGNPVSGANIAVNMTENEFMFGAAISENEVLDEYLDLETTRGQMLDGFMNNDMNTGVAADNLKAGGIVSTDAAAGIEMINEFISRGKRVRGHAVFWDGESLMPFDRAKQMTYQELYKRTMDYVRPLAYTFKGRLSHWDVLNEPHDSNYIRTTFNTTRLYTDIFKEVKKIDPDVKLYVNETGMEGRPHKGYEDRVPNFLNIVKQMQAQGAPIDGIGIQAHCTKYNYPQGFYHQLDECASVVDEVSVTEYDFYNGDTTYAPNHLEDTLLATFSHPKATAFIVWGIEDSMHWRWNANCAPFFDRDWNKKPAYDMWKKLIDQDFATNTTLVTDAKGKASVRAFRGDYEITCSYGGKTAAVPLGNTVDGGSSVKFVVGSSISGTASNGVREQLEPIEFNNMSEAKQEYDSLNTPYYKGVILDRNFKGSETTELVQNGGDLLNNSDYQAGKTWGSYSGNTDILYGGDWGSTIIHTNGTPQSGELRLKAEGTERYSGTKLHHEAMFYTLDADVSGEVIIHTGVSKGGDAGNDLNLARIIYKDGKYTIETMDDQIVELNKDSFYTLDTAICGDSVEYTLYLSDEIVYEHSFKLNSSVVATEYDEVVYLLSANCSEGDIFKLHNARLFEYKDSELIEFSDTDYETYVLDESMKDFDVNSVEYLGTALTDAPENWGIIGKDNSVSDFVYRKSGAYLSAARSNPNGEHSIVKGFDPISDGESLEFTFNMMYDASSQYYSTGGYAYIGLGSADKSKYINLVSHDYDQWNGFSSKFLNLDETKTNISGGTTNEWNKNNLTVTFTLTPSENGGTYDAYILIEPRTGNETREASIPDLFTADEVEQLDTFFLSSATYSYYSNPITGIGNSILGVKNLKIRKHGNTIYAGGEASLASGEHASLGIMYNNVTQVYNTATVIVAGYDEENMLVSCDVKNYTMKPGKGAFDFDIDNETDGAVKYRIYLVDGTNNIMPYKADDVITIK